uniref:DUF2207 family protein n=1 Tax=Microbacterium sp. SORGH_AS_1204 TaxID=3041785 RepID=UPI0027D88663|nr:DUF2207 domain-containing protein [Microbacterium sp. SORGH_AS_1204]
MAGALVLLAVATALVVAAIVVRVRSLRLPHSLVVEYAPRPRATVVDDAILAGQERRAVAAGLVDLVVRGRVHLLTENGVSRKSMAVQVIAPETLTDDERRLLEVVCGPETPSGYSRRLSRDRRRIARGVRAFVAQRGRRLQREGLLRGWHPGRSVIRWSSALLVLGVGFFLSTAPAPAAFGVGVAALALALVALAVVPRGLARRFTPAATPRREHLDGIRQYLTLAEADRLRVLQSPAGSRQQAGDAVERFAVNERLLPYAVMFGLTPEWLTTLKIGYDELGQTSPHTLAEVGDGFLQVMDIEATVKGVVNIVFATDHALDAAGAVLDGLF